MKSIWKKRLAAVMAGQLCISMMGSMSVLANGEAEEAFETSEEVDDTSMQIMPEEIENETGSTPQSPLMMFRLYNPNSGEHFYTSSGTEKDHLTSVGWRYEGIGWMAPVKSDIPVYRLYNPNAGDHHYTTDAGERDSLKRVGWKDEGIGWYSDPNKSPSS